MKEKKCVSKANKFILMILKFTIFY